MSHIASDVQLIRGPLADLVIAVPAELRPLDEVLEDCRRFPPLLQEAIRHARKPGQSWDHGGNATWIEIAGDTVTLSHQFTDAEATLPRARFLQALLDFRQQLATWENTSQRS